MPVTAYTPNIDEILYQLIDGEYIFLYRPNGNYFSLDNLGVLVWESVLHHIPRETFLEWFKDAFPDCSEEVVRSLSAVFDDLLAEGLALKVLDNIGITVREVDEILQGADAQGWQHIPAQLHAYKNIQEKYAHPCGVKEI